MEGDSNYLQCAKGARSAGKTALAKAVKKNRYNPFTTPMQKNDILLFNVRDSENKMCLIEGANEDYYVICTLIRKGRKVSYSFYPVTVMRYYQKVVENEAKDAGDPVYVSNTGDIPALVGTESIEDYACENWLGGSLTIRNTKIEKVWKFKKFEKKDKYTNDDFKESKGTLYDFKFDANVVKENEWITFDKPIEEIVKEMNEPQIS